MKRLPGATKQEMRPRRRRCQPVRLYAALAPGTTATLLLDAGGRSEGVFLPVGCCYQQVRMPGRLVFGDVVRHQPQVGASALAPLGLLQIPSYQTAWVWLHNLRRAMAWEEPLHGAVEVGTAGLWGFRRAAKRRDRHCGHFAQRRRGHRPSVWMHHPTPAP